jgi:hypothetical protein
MAIAIATKSSKRQYACPCSTSDIQFCGRPTRAPLRLRQRALRRFRQITDQVRVQSADGARHQRSWQGPCAESGAAPRASGRSCAESGASDAACAHTRTLEVVLYALVRAGEHAHGMFQRGADRTDLGLLLELL